MRVSVTIDGNVSIITENSTELFAIRKALGINGNTAEEIMIIQTGRGGTDWVNGHSEIVIGKK